MLARRPFSYATDTSLHTWTLSNREFLGDFFAGLQQLASLCREDKHNYACTQTIFPCKGMSNNSLQTGTLANREFFLRGFFCRFATTRFRMGWHCVNINARFNEGFTQKPLCRFKSFYVRYRHTTRLPSFAQQCTQLPMFDVRRYRYLYAKGTFSRMRKLCSYFIHVSKGCGMNSDGAF